MEVMVIHEDNIAPYSSMEAFDVSIIDKNPENYIFFMTPDEFSELSTIYVEMGAEAGKAVKEKRQIKILPKWEKHGILCGLAATFTLLGLESSQKLGLENGYVMGTLTPYTLGKNMYAVFLTKRKDKQIRSKEVMRQVLDWQSYSGDKTPNN